jgi:hypothetical protein
LPIALSVIASLGAGLNCAASRRIDGTAIAIRISTGTSVHTISMNVLCAVRLGVGLAARR